VSSARPDEASAFEEFPDGRRFQAARHRAQRLVAEARGRNENSVQDLAGLTQVVEEYEAVNRQYDITGLRWVVHHVPAVTRELLSRLQALGCGVQMAAFRWVTSSDPKVIVGPPFRTIVDHGVRAGIHGDGVHIAPLNPWLHIAFATTGVNSFGDRVNGDQQITRQEALRLFTRGNSWFLRMEDRRCRSAGVDSQAVHGSTLRSRVPESRGLPGVRGSGRGTAGRFSRAGP
jgi:hypothetical protein